MPSLDLARSGRIKIWVLIAWPAFLAACLLEAVVFAAVDPSEVHWPGQSVQPSRQAVYTAAFFGFWVIAMACTSLALWLNKPQRDINASIRD